MTKNLMTLAAWNSLRATNRILTTGSPPLRILERVGEVVHELLETIYDLQNGGFKLHPLDTLDDCKLKERCSEILAIVE